MYFETYPNLSEPYKSGEALKWVTVLFNKGTETNNFELLISHFHHLLAIHKGKRKWSDYALEFRCWKPVERDFTTSCFFQGLNDNVLKKLACRDEALSLSLNPIIILYSAPAGDSLVLLGAFGAHVGNDSAGPWLGGRAPDLNPSCVLLLDFSAGHGLSIMNIMFKHKGVHMSTWH